MLREKWLRAEPPNLGRLTRILPGGLGPKQRLPRVGSKGKGKTAAGRHVVCPYWRQRWEKGLAQKGPLCDDGVPPDQCSAIFRDAENGPFPALPELRSPCQPASAIERRIVACFSWIARLDLKEEKSMPAQPA